MSRKKKLSKIISYSALFLCIITIYSALIIFVAFLPRNVYYEDNLQKSSNYFVDHLDYPTSYGVRFDNYTDARMYNIMWYTNYGNPFKAAFAGQNLNKYAEGYKETHEAIWENPAPNEYYTRYWHGYLVFLKPISYLLEYQEIRWWNMLLFFTSFLICGALIFKNINWQLSVAFALAIVMIDIHMIPMSIQFSTVINLSFLSIIALFWFIKHKPEMLLKLFFVIGSLTMFLDFYTYPFMSLGLPLIVLISYKIKKESSLKSLLILSLQCVGIWLAGYVFTWIAKILISSAILGGQEISQVIGSVKFRMTRGTEGLSFIQESVRSILLCYNTALIYEYRLLFYTWIKAWIVFFTLFGKTIKKLIPLIGLSIVFMLPLIWFALAINPIKIHSWFQFRGIAISFMVAFYVLLYSVDYNKILTPIKSIKERFWGFISFVKNIGHKKTKKL